MVQPFNLGVDPKLGLGSKGKDDKKSDKQVGFLNQGCVGPYQTLNLHLRGALDEPQSNRTAVVGREQLGNKTRS